jgi:hypothetical protein
MHRALLYLLSIATVASLWVGAGVGAQSTQVLVVPPSSTAAPGGTVTVQVQVRDVQDLYAVDLQMAFDPAVLEVLDADGEPANGTQITAGNFLSSPYGFTAVNRADNTTGEIRYIYSLLSPAAPVSGGGVLVSISLRARNPGSSTLLLQVLLADDQAGYIPAVVTDGLIVVSGDTATPTGTATVTLTATPVVTPTVSRTPPRTLTRTPSPTAVATATRTGTSPVRDHFLWLPLLLRALSVPTLTPLPSATPTPTATAIPTYTASATAIVEATPSPSQTASVTLAATRSPTPTPTASTIPSTTPSATPTGAPTPSPTPESRQLLLDSSFEVEDDNVWAREGGAQPLYSLARAHSGVRSMRLGIIQPQSQPVWSSIWQEVGLPDHITEAGLSLYYFPVGWPEDADDLYVYVTRASDGATLFSDRWMQWEQTWHPYTVDLLSRLQPYAGQRVRLRIGLYNNGDGMTVVYVDDVELWVAGGY